jgi:hypothetical protein
MEPQAQNNENESIFDKFKNKDGVNDYSVRFRKIYKGKMAPTGLKYIEVTVPIMKEKIIMVKLIPGINKEAEELIALEMRLQIHLKYKI